VVSDALCRFQNASDATPPDAQSVTESRKSCEVPSCPSFPQDAFVVGVASSGRNGPNDHCQMISRTNNATIAAKTAEPDPR
jgi:hypothetical protein